MNVPSQVHVVKAPVMTTKEGLFYSVLVGIGLGITLIFAFWWFRISHIPTNFSGMLHILDFFLFAILSYIIWYQVLFELFLWSAGYFMRHPIPLKPQPKLRVAFLTAFVPGKEPYDVLEKTLQAMKKAHYKHDTWVLDEGDDPEVKRLCRLYRVKHFSRHGRRRYNREEGKFRAKTKAGNYNAWFDRNGSQYDIVAQIDVDFVPKRDFLLKTLGYFQDPRVGFVGSPQIYGNTNESWIVKGAAEQAYGFFGPIQKGLFHHDMSLFIGANHVVRVKAHNTIDGYSGHIVEDHLTGMKFYEKGWKSVYVPEVLAVGEGPTTWDAYFSQQMRWSYGLFHILFTQTPKLLFKLKLKHALHYLILQHYYFYGLIQSLAVLLLLLYFAFGIHSTSMQVLELLLFYSPLLLMQAGIFFYLQRFNIDPLKEKGFMLRAKLLNVAAWPIYFLALISVVTRKRLTYKVTPKGKQQEERIKVSLFLPHFIFGSVTLFGIISSFLTHHQASQHIFWAWLNTVAMFYFVLNAVLTNVSLVVDKFFQRRFTLPNFGLAR